MAMVKKQDGRDELCSHALSTRNARTLFEVKVSEEVLPAWCLVSEIGTTRANVNENASGIMTSPKRCVRSGPSQKYPQRAYRNPLDRLVAFLDAKHGDGWAIWEFRAEGTGYPDEAVYGRIRHYPWPDHHPPPFGLVPLIMASMRQWLDGGEEEQRQVGKKRVVVAHCKAGKGRSGTMACSYLISQCGWTPQDALARFTARRMRPRFGAGVTIPSQLRWVGYVDRWTRGGRKYVDGDVEVVEVRVRGLRQGVKVSVRGFADEGKKIRPLHTFAKAERMVVEGDAPGSAGVVDMVLDMAGYGQGGASTEGEGAACEPDDATKKHRRSRDRDTSQTTRGASERIRTSLMRNVSKRQASSSEKAPSSNTVASARTAQGSAPGGRAVTFKPAQPIRVPNGDVNIAMERSHSAPSSVGLTMVTSVAHVWFNAFFEGRGPEQDAKPDGGGVFEVKWKDMDGIKGSSQKGSRACDGVSVVWRFVAGTAGSEEEEAEQAEAAVGPDGHGVGPVPQMRPADWKGGNEEDAHGDDHLGVRTQTSPEDSGSSGEEFEGVKTSGPSGEHVTKDVGQSSMAH